MGDAAKYLSGRTGAWLDTEYDHFGRDCDDCHDWAIDSIVNRRTPAVIGTGWLNHYPMATAYARQTRIVRLKWGSFSFNMYVTDEVFYIPGVDRIAVSSQSGKLRFYDAASYALIKTLDFGAEANTDNMRYDPAGKRIYVAYGERQGGALAMVDPATMERVQEFKLGSHPESFQLEQNGSRIFVNLPDQEAFGVIDRKTGALMKWKIPGNNNNHTLALDEAAVVPAQARDTIAYAGRSGRLALDLPRFG